MAAEELILWDKFYLFPRSKHSYNVKLHPHRLTYKPTTYANNTSEGGAVDVKDVIGCHVMKGRHTDDYMAYFCIYSYPYRKRILSKLMRRRETITFCIDHFDTFEKNKELADIWRAKILSLVHSGKPVLPEGKKYLILLNPFSGPRKALQLFKEKIAVMLGESELPYKLVITEYANYARNMMKSLVLSEWAGVVIVSGDGLIFEVINGLMERDDWREAMKLPIGALPGGTSNALCCSINFRAGEPYIENIVMHSTFVLLKQITMPADLVYIENSKQKLFSFLSTCWGFVADIDIDSEKYRSIGPARYKITAFAKILKMKQYRGRISFIPAKPYTRPEQRNQLKNSSSTACQTDKNWDEILNELEIDETCERRITRTSSVIEAEILSNAMKEQLEDITEQHIDDHACNDHSSNDSISNDHSSDSDHLTDDQQTNDQCTYNNGTRDYASDQSASDHSMSDHLTSDHDADINKFRLENCNLLVGLNEELPDNWITIEDDFILVVASYQSHIAPDLCPCPEARFDDGLMYLSLMRSGISRSALLSTIVSLDITHQETPYIENIPCLAFRIEPITVEGRMTVDGELVSTETIQGQILPNMMNLITACDNQ